MSSSSGTTSATEAVADISPKPPQPLYPDVPWWAVLVASIVFLVLGLIIGVYTGAFPSVSGVGSGGSLAMDTIAYLPHIILLFGVLADMFTLEGVWSIPSLVGLLSIFANALFKYFWKGIDALFDSGVEVFKKAAGTGTPPGQAPAGQSGNGRSKKGGASFSGKYDGCAVQGFESFNSAYAPQTLVVTASVFSYYCFDLIRNRGWINSIAAILGFLVLYIGEVVIIDLNVTENSGKQAKGCSVDGDIKATPGQGIRAFFEGLLFGGVSYGIVQTYAPNRLPSSTISPFPRKTVDDLSPGPDGKMYDKDGYPFIVLPNGQAVPDVSDARSRAAFGALAGTATGQMMTLGAGCPGRTATCPNA